MCDLPQFNSEHLLVGFETSDDAAVYQLNEEQAIIQTLDFFTPIVNDPYDFGMIAAANALSDVYAMGGQPTVAMNIVGFPNCLDVSILKEIMRGGADKVKEANALLVGGHSIQDDEPKYGLSVMGIVHPEKIWRNVGLQVGDVLILTKPLGMGILTTALKEDLLNTSDIQEVTQYMSTLNKIPVEIAREKYSVHACTDVTGFGFLGHLLEMAKGSGVKLEVESTSIPVIERAFEFAEMGIIPAGAYTNRYHAEKYIHFDASIREALIDICYDPQTSGGLLFSIPMGEAASFLNELSLKYQLPCAVIGQVVQQFETKSNLESHLQEDTRIYIEIK